MTNLDSILKSRDMYGCENWTIKKAEHQRIDAFELWCWKRLLRVPWTARRSVLGVHWKDWCWRWNSNTLAIWCEELTHWKRPWCWERLRAGGEGSDRGWNGWMASPSQWTRVWVGSRIWCLTGRPGMLWSHEGRKEVCDLFSLTEYLLHDGCFYTFNFETSSLRMAVSSPLKQIER